MTNKIKKFSSSPIKLIGLCVLLTLVLTFEFWFLGTSSFLRAHDTWDSIASRDIFMMRSLKEDGPSLWSPLAGGGFDKVSNDMKYLHTSAILQFFFPGWFGYIFLIVGSYSLQLFTVYLFAKKSLKLPAFEAILAGFFSVAAYLCHYPLFGRADVGLSLALFPLILLWFESLNQEGSFKLSRQSLMQGVALLVVYSVTSSLIWFLMFAPLAAGVWFILGRFQKDIRFWMCFIGFWVLSFLLHTNDIIAMGVYTANSHRTAWNFMDETLWEQITARIEFVPRHFILFSLFAGGWLIWKKALNRTCVKLMLIYLTLFAFIPIVFDIARNILKNYIPILRSVNLDRTMHFSNIFLGLVVGYAISLVYRNIKQEHQRKFAISFCVITFFIVFSGKLLHFYNNKSNFKFSYKHHMANKHLQFIKEKLDQEELPYRIATVGNDPSVAHLKNIETIGGYLNLYPLHYNLFWKKLIGPIMELNWQVDEYFLGYGSRLYLYVQGQDIIEHRVVPFKKYYDLDLLSLANVKYIWSYFPIETEDLIALKEGAPEMAVSKAKKWKNLIKANFGQFSKRFAGYVYENPYVLPRFFFVENFEEIDGESEMFDILAQYPLDKLKTTVLVESDKLKNRNYAFQNNSIDVLQYTPDKIRLKVNLDGDAILVVTNTYNPYWISSIDGKPQSIFRTYGTFWGIEVSSGAHEIEFQYKPPFGAL